MITPLGVQARMTLLADYPGSAAGEYKMPSPAAPMSRATFLAGVLEPPKNSGQHQQVAKNTWKTSKVAGAPNKRFQYN
jgi:hypothetical protein